MRIRLATFILESLREVWSGNTTNVVGYSVQIFYDATRLNGAVAGMHIYSESLKIIRSISLPDHRIVFQAKNSAIQSVAEMHIQTAEIPILRQDTKLRGNYLRHGIWVMKTSEWKRGIFYSCKAGELVRLGTTIQLSDEFASEYSLENL